MLLHFTTIRRSYIYIVLFASFSVLCTSHSLTLIFIYQGNTFIIPCITPTLPHAVYSLLCPFPLPPQLALSRASPLTHQRWKLFPHFETSSSDWEFVQCRLGAEFKLLHESRLLAVSEVLVNLNCRVLLCLPSEQIICAMYSQKATFPSGYIEQ